MGGRAFPDLWTPRMPAAVYHHVRAQLHSQLGAVFADLGTPVEGPGKTDFGDVDILVASPRDPTPSMIALFKVIEKTLQPIATNVALADSSINLAIPWPTEFPAPEQPPAAAPIAETLRESALASVSSPEREQCSVFIQVDIHIYNSTESWKWALFRHSHGDFWAMLGTIVRPFGLSAGDTALYLRITEIEKFDRKRGRIFITDEPDAVLKFLGLESKGSFWEGPADSDEALFEYVATSPLFYVSPNNDSAKDQEALSSKHQKRAKSRPCYNKWLTEFFPRCREQGRFTTPRVTKEQIQKTLYDTLGDDLRREYETTRDNFLDEQAANKWARTIRSFFKSQNLPSAFIYGSLVKAFKQILLHRDPTYESVGAVFPDTLKGPKWEWDESVVVNFIQATQDGVLQEIQRVAALKRAVALAKAEARKKAEAETTERLDGEEEEAEASSPD
ncbi:hypothetical protein BROUX41_005616 [Berkeleyomyces rouxiae]|uniref:uncharacterized protein n=1 Tax=Berkeleyomyces rouxiae TaxID=2035830 RepID=UPI003B7C19CD